MAAPATAEASGASFVPSASFTPSFMPSSQFSAQQLAQAGPLDTSRIPESHPVGMQPAAAAIPRPTGIAGLISTGAQTLSALQKVWKQVSGTDSAEDADIAVTAAQPGTYSRNEGYSSSQGRGSVGVASLKAKSAAAVPSASAWSNSMQQQMAQPAVRAVPKDFMPITVYGASPRQNTAAGRSGARKVSVASVNGVGGAAAAPTAGMAALQQHISGYQQPQPAAAGSSVQVASVAGSKRAADSSSSSDMSIDDMSDATGAPVAQLSFKPATRVHVPYAPAARIMSAAPVSPYLLQSAMPSVAVAAAVNAGAVSHHQTPTWVPSA
jgi:hypothetical protein